MEGGDVQGHRALDRARGVHAPFHPYEVGAQGGARASAGEGEAAQGVRDKAHTRREEGAGDLRGKEEGDAGRDAGRDGFRCGDEEDRGEDQRCFRRVDGPCASPCR